MQRQLYVSCMSFTQCYLRAQISSSSLAPEAPHFLTLSLGFITSCADSSLFVYSLGNVFLYFLVYVDDLIITGSDPSLVDTIIQQLDSKFFTKDLGALSYLCGVEIFAISPSLPLSQQKYVIDLLSKHNMLESKPVSTPLAVGTSLTPKDRTASINATMYRQVVSGLQHLRMTRSMSPLQ